SGTWGVRPSKSIVVIAVSPSSDGGWSSPRTVRAQAVLRVFAGVPGPPRGSPRGQSRAPGAGGAGLGGAGFGCAGQEAAPGGTCRGRGGARLRRSGAVALVAVALTAHRDPPHPGDVHQARHELAERRPAVEAGRDDHQGPAVLVDAAGAVDRGGEPH